jgi:hypothetical protein
MKLTPTSSVSSFGYLLVGMISIFLPAMVQAANLPLTDLILFGKVYQKSSHAPIVGSLPGAIQVKINNAIIPADTVIASTADLLTASGDTEARYYVLRIRRFDAGTPRQAGDTFVIPSDRLRIFLAGVEVAETEVPAMLATDAQGDVRLLHLNAKPISDNDNDGMPDNWEEEFLGGLAQAGNGDANRDGITNFLAYAFGLDPRVNNSSRLPFLALETNNHLVFYFRQSLADTGLSYTVKAVDQLGSDLWQPVQGVVTEQIGTEGNSRIIKAVIPGGVDRRRRFFSLFVNP